MYAPATLFSCLPLFRFHSLSILLSVGINSIIQLSLSPVINLFGNSIHSLLACRIVSPSCHASFFFFAHVTNSDVTLSHWDLSGSTWIQCDERTALHHTKCVPGSIPTTKETLGMMHCLQSFILVQAEQLIYAYTYLPSLTKCFLINI